MYCIDKPTPVTVAISGVLMQPQIACVMDVLSFILLLFYTQTNYLDIARINLRSFYTWFNFTVLLV